MNLFITHIDTACLILEINGYRIMTDPVLGRAGKLYHFGYGAMSRKLNNPAVNRKDIGSIDLVLLSHHQHQDNFDPQGQAFTRFVPLVISTKNAAKKLNNAVGLNPWQAIEVNTEKVPGLKITATPARHHPRWLPGFFAGKVTGFIIEYQNQPDGVIYISGDTVLFDALDDICNKFTIDKAILHLGSVQFPYLSGFGKYTMNAADGIILAEKLKANKVVPVHTSGWSHFKEKETHAKAVFNNAAIASKTIWLKPGERVNL
jgi:L-ascorbate metabolism protein UlaG (beta-lactamase superfamily)